MAWHRDHPSSDPASLHRAGLSGAASVCFLVRRGALPRTLPPGQHLSASTVTAPPPLPRTPPQALLLITFTPTSPDGHKCLDFNKVRFLLS